MTRVLITHGFDHIGAHVIDEDSRLHCYEDDTIAGLFGRQNRANLVYLIKLPSEQMLKYERVPVGETNFNFSRVPVAAVIAGDS